jgi:uncharacterized protein (TIGR02594 family)
MCKENLQGIYSWLKTEPIPKMVDEALRFYGVKNNYNDANNPITQRWGDRLGLDVRQFYEYNSHRNFNDNEMIEYANSESMNGSRSVFGQNLKVVTEGHFVPWCGLFMGYVAKESGINEVDEPCWPLHWENFGVGVEVPMLGDILIFIRLSENRKKAGSLGLYIGEDKDCYHVLGGNQDEKVCITRILKSRLYVARRPKYKEVPDCVKKISLPSNCTLVQKYALCM